MIKAILLSVLVTAVVARESPSAQRVRDWLKQEDHASKYSNNILEDAQLDVPDLVRKYGYPFESHTVLTTDGYLLELHRIPHGKGQGSLPRGRQPVLVNHGMFGSSADWIIAGPSKALGYVLADAGYDVWMTNARGNYYSRNHISLNPDKGVDFWKFSWDEIGRNDLAAAVDYVLANTGFPKTHFVGHSQGGTTFFVLTSMRPEYNDKILSVQLMAPAMFNTVDDRPGLDAVAPYLGVLENILYLSGNAEMFPNGDRLSSFAAEYCSDGTIWQLLCTAAFSAFAGSSPSQHNATMIPLMLGHTPAGASFRQIAHFSQVITSGEFRRYDYGTSVANVLNYGSRRPPQYNLSRVTLPIYSYYSEADKSVEPRSIFILHSHLPNTGGIFKVEHDTFTHIDFLYGNDARTLVYDRIVRLIRNIDGQ